VTGRFSVVCECDDKNCIEQIDVAADSYDQVREDATTFIVCPGHEAPKVETVDVVNPGTWCPEAQGRTNSDRGGRPTHAPDPSSRPAGIV
jgi:hypothetical protein